MGLALSDLLFCHFVHWLPHPSNSWDCHWCAPRVQDTFRSFDSPLPCKRVKHFWVTNLWEILFNRFVLHSKKGSDFPLPCRKGCCIQYLNRTVFFLQLKCLFKCYSFPLVFYGLYLYFYIKFKSRKCMLAFFYYFFTLIKLTVFIWPKQTY